MRLARTGAFAVLVLLHPTLAYLLTALGLIYKHEKNINMEKEYKIRSFSYYVTIKRDKKEQKDAPKIRMLKIQSCGNTTALFLLTSEGGPPLPAYFFLWRCPRPFYLSVSVSLEVTGHAHKTHTQEKDRKRKGNFNTMYSSEDIVEVFNFEEANQTVRNLSY